MRTDHSGTRSTAGAARRRLGRAHTFARIGALAALALSLALLSLGCSTPEQMASAGPVVETPTAALIEEAPVVGVDLAPVEVATPTPSEPADSPQEAIPEDSAPAEVEIPVERPSLASRSGQRVEESADLGPEFAPDAENMANATAPGAASRATPAVAKAASTRLVVRAATPTPKPVARAATPKPRVAVSTKPVSTGPWVELPNVRPIPSAYYAAVHRWDPIVNHYAQVYRVDPDLIRRIIYVESKGYQYAYVASTGVKGLMQITPMWFKAGENPYDPSTNIGRGTYILRRGYDAYHTWFKAVSYYCYGPLRSTISTRYADLIFSPIIRSL